MKIEAGKYYKLRNGARIFVCVINKPGLYPVLSWNDRGHPMSYKESGKYVGDAGHPEDPLDIVSEWRDELEIPWDKLFPPWVKWFAVDEDGEQAGFELEPHSDSAGWYAIGGGYAVLPPSQRVPFTGDWKESLTERK